ncbi:hypothetical protein AVEN_99012-1 [Araneus ventricosus]|uniref:Uncharacterized protein n=1 Tax=Araneus ventricosus TaxID=182803 RepID=A0A4Y2G5R5_ARAVE|nr:hypothetical protein AVEN_99012-1 [Araneus ventricosus]
MNEFFRFKSPNFFSSFRYVSKDLNRLEGKFISKKERSEDDFAIIPIIKAFPEMRRLAARGLLSSEAQMRASFPCKSSRKVTYPYVQKLSQISTSGAAKSH